MTIKEIPFAQTIKEEDKIMNFGNNEINTIDYLKRHYLDAKNNNLVTSFIKNLT